MIWIIGRKTLNFELNLELDLRETEEAIEVSK